MSERRAVVPWVHEMKTKMTGPLEIPEGARLSLTRPEREYIRWRWSCNAMVRARPNMGGVKAMTVTGTQRHQQDAADFAMKLLLNDGDAMAQVEIVSEQVQRLQDAPPMQMAMSQMTMSPMAMQPQMSMCSPWGAPHMHMQNPYGYQQPPPMWAPPQMQPMNQMPMWVPQPPMPSLRFTNARLAKEIAEEDAEEEELMKEEQKLEEEQRLAVVAVV